MINTKKVSFSILFGLILYKLYIYLKLINN